MLLDIFFIGIILAALLAIIFFVFFLKKPYKWEKKIKGNGVVFIFEAGKDLKMVELDVGQGKEAMAFRRQNLKKGEKVEFNYAVSAQPAKLVVEDQGVRKTHDI